jgi:enoyl-CoA hydratase
VPSLIDLRVDATVATITLRNPARRNAMTRAMWRELRAVAVSIHGSEHRSLERGSSENSSCSRDIPLGYSCVRCVIIQGEAGHFCAGGDISEYPEFRFNEASLRAFHEDEVAPALHALLALDMPLIAQIEGNCMGGGLEIAACCDIRIAGQSATFGAPIAKLGMPMAPQELAIVLRAAGEATVREMLLEARSFNAQQMQGRGFVQRVLADDAVATEAQATAQGICKLSPQAARLNKQALRKFFMLNTPAGQWNIAGAATNVVVSQDNSYAYANSAEHKEGITAFLEKRSAQF